VDNTEPLSKNNIINNEKDIYVISDLHIFKGKQLSDNEPLSCFIKELNAHAKKEDFDLILNGDVADFWREEPMHTYFHFRDFLAKFDESAWENKKIYYLIGNHDFNMWDLAESVEQGNNFIDMLKRDLPDFLELIFPERYIIIKRNGKSILVTHGDVCNFYYFFQNVIQKVFSQDVYTTNIDETLNELFSKMNGKNARIFTVLYMIVILFPLNWGKML